MKMNTNMLENMPYFTSDFKLARINEPWQGQMHFFIHQPPAAILWGGHSMVLYDKTVVLRPWDERVGDQDTDCFSLQTAGWDVEPGEL